MSQVSFPRARLLAAAFLFSTGGLAIKACSLTSWQVATFRCAVSFAFLLIFLKEARRFPPWRMIVVGFIYAAMVNSYVMANKWTTATNAVFLQTTAPLYILLFSPLILGERGRWRDVPVMVALALGLGLLFVGEQSPTSTATNPFLGNIVGAFSGFFWAAVILGLRYLGRGQQESALPAVVVGNAIASLTALPFAFPVASFSTADVLLVIYLGAFQIGLAYVLLTGAMAHVPALDASLLLLVEPVFSPVWTYVVLGETPGPWAVAGAGIILAAIILKSIIEWRDEQRRST